MIRADGRHLWIILLAGGNGRRVRDLTRDDRGECVPKQFWSAGRRRPMVSWALDRALSLAPPQRTLAVVSREHERWWNSPLSVLPAENLVVQPADRGTAAGVLLPLMWILARDPAATVVVLPTDHFVENEEIIRSRIAEAAAVAQRRPDRVVLLAALPPEKRAQLGWIVPRRQAGPARPAPVAAFVEKPDPRSVERLVRKGALANMFILCANLRTLLGLFHHRTPELARSFLTWSRWEAPAGETPDALYESIRPCDLSTDVLRPSSDRLSVLPVPPCGWTDLGTPERLASFLRHHPG